MGRHGSVHPNAFLFGLTGTPINRAEKNTFYAFGAEEDEGGYISRYGFEDSIRDGATKELHFEPRLVELHIDQKAIDRQLATGKFDTVTLIHNETSTGVVNPLPEICCTLAKYPDVALVLDTVSSFSGVRIDMDALGIDVMLTGAQKALALPPGFSLFSVSGKAFDRAEKIPNRGFYFDFLEFKKQRAEWMTPSTPSIAHMHALQSKLEEIFEEGLEARFARHARTNALVHDWVRRAGFDFFAEDGFRSKTLTCVKNNKEIDVLELAKKLREKHHLVIDPGYGKIRGKTFRLSNMGDETEATVAHLLSCLDDVL